MQTKKINVLDFTGDIQELRDLIENADCDIELTNDEIEKEEAESAKTDVNETETETQENQNQETTTTESKTEEKKEPKPKKEQNKKPKKEAEQKPQEEKKEPEDKAKRKLDTKVYYKPKNYNIVKTLVENKEPVLLVGNAGTGKTEMCKHIAEELNIAFYTDSAVSDEYKLLGFIDANGNYQETQFYKAFKYGGLYLLDEMDSSNAEALVRLNSAIANGFMAFPNGQINAHPDFRVVATANTYGTGADSVYVGRTQLDGATLDRFGIVEIDYSKEVEEKLCTNEQLLEFIRNFRKAVNRLRMRVIVSYRCIKALSRFIEEGSIPVKQLLKIFLTKSLQKDEIREIIGEMQFDGSEYMNALQELSK